MPAKKDDKSKNAPKSDPKPQTAEGADRHSDTPDGGKNPMVYDARGDAHEVPIEPDHSPEAAAELAKLPQTTDPLLHPDAQQPGESAEDYQRRVSRS